MLGSRKGRNAGILRTPTAVHPHTVEAASTATAAAQACNQNNPPELPRHASDKALTATELRFVWGRGWRRIRPIGVICVQEREDGLEALRPRRGNEMPPLARGGA